MDVSLRLLSVPKLVSRGVHGLCNTMSDPFSAGLGNVRPMTGTARHVRRLLTQPVDNTFLVYFRVAFGAMMIWCLLKYFRQDLVRTMYLEPRIHFTYYGFDWVKPWSGPGMYAHFLVTAIAAGSIMVGFAYRLSTTVFFLGFTYIFLIDECWYLNHYYLICLLAFLLMMVPAQCAFSVDALRKPGLHSGTVPAWVLWILRFQIGVPYFFGGIAKLNADWLHGEPMRTWLAQKTEFPVIGPYFTEQWCVALFVWGGLLLDLFAVPLLLWRPTRLLTLMAVWMFHGINSQLFDIGVFPWLMLVETTLVYLPTRWTGRLRFWRPPDDGRVVSDSMRHNSRWAPSLLCGFVAVQLLIPFRHFLYPGHVAFTREGHCFSWRMKLNIRDRDFQLAVHYEDGTQEAVDLWEWVTWPQFKHMVSPGQVLQLAHFIREHEEHESGMRAEVRGTITAALNGRDPEVLVNDEFDLSRQRRGLLPARWIRRPVLSSIASVAGISASSATESGD